MQKHLGGKQLNANFVGTKRKKEISGFVPPPPEIQLKKSQALKSFLSEHFIEIEPKTNIFLIYNTNTYKFISINLIHIDIRHVGLFLKHRLV